MKKPFKLIILLVAVIPFVIYAEGEEKPTLNSEYSTIQKLLNYWENFNPIIETETNFADKNAQTEIMGGTANQKFSEMLTLGAGGKYAKTLDEKEIYLALANLRLNFKRVGNIRIHHEHLLKGEEIWECPPKTIFNWDIPLFPKWTLLLSEEHRWSDKFAGDFASTELQRAIGNNVAMYTRYAIQRYSSECKTHQGILGARNTFEIIEKLKLGTHVEYIKELKNSEFDYKGLSFSLNHWSSDLSMTSIRTNSWLRRKEYNHTLNAEVMFPLKIGFYLGDKGDLVYNDREEDNDDWFLNNCTGIAYIPRYTGKFRIVGNITQRISDTPCEKSNQLIKTVKVNLHPISSIKTSLKYAISPSDKTLTSIWVKYLNKWFEFGIGGRALYSRETNTTNYGISIEGGIIRFNFLPIVCGYKVGYNIMGINDASLVDGFYQEQGIYIKTRFGDNNLEELFGEQ